MHTGILQTNDETKEYLQRKAELLRRDEERQYNMMVFGTEKYDTTSQGVCSGAGIEY